MNCLICLKQKRYQIRRSFAAIEKQIYPNLKIVLTGSGKVAHGAKEILDAMKVKQVSVEDYLNKTFAQPVYTFIDVLDYNKRKDGQCLDKWILCTS